MRAAAKQCDAGRKCRPAPMIHGDLQRTSICSGPWTLAGKNGKVTKEQVSASASKASKPWPLVHRIVIQIRCMELISEVTYQLRVRRCNTSVPARSWEFPETGTTLVARLMAHRVPNDGGVRCLAFKQRSRAETRKSPAEPLRGTTGYAQDDQPRFGLTHMLMSALNTVSFWRSLMTTRAIFSAPSLSSPILSSWASARMGPSAFFR